MGISTSEPLSKATSLPLCSVALSLFQGLDKTPSHLQLTRSCCFYYGTPSQHEMIPVQLEILKSI